MEANGKEVQERAVRSSENGSPPRINVVRLSIIFALSIFFPLFLGLMIDWLYGPSISAIGIAAVLSIPVVATAVGWALVAEMGRVVQIVAPDTVDEDGFAVEDGVSAPQP